MGGEYHSSRFNSQATGILFIMLVISKEDVKKQAMPLPPIKGKYIYFLLRGGEIVYVGQASNNWNLQARIASHRAKRRIDFDSFAHFDVEDYGCLSEIEADNIIAHDPPFNKLIPPSQDAWISCASAAKRCDTTPAAFRRAAIAKGCKMYHLNGAVHFNTEELAIVGILV